MRGRSLRDGLRVARYQAIDGCGSAADAYRDHFGNSSRHSSDLVTCNTSDHSPRHPRFAPPRHPSHRAIGRGRGGAAGAAPFAPRIDEDVRPRPRVPGRAGGGRAADPGPAGTATQGTGHWWYWYHRAWAAGRKNYLLTPFFRPRRKLKTGNGRLRPRSGRYFGCGMSPAVVAHLPALTRSYSSFTQGIFSALRSIHSGTGVRSPCLSSSANSTTTSSRV